MTCAFCVARRIAMCLLPRTPLNNRAY
jgi:hypothetical protein